MQRTPTLSEIEERIAVLKNFDGPHRLKYDNVTVEHVRIIGTWYRLQFSGQWFHNSDKLAAQLEEYQNETGDTQHMWRTLANVFQKTPKLDGKLPTKIIDMFEAAFVDLKITEEVKKIAYSASKPVEFVAERYLHHVISENYLHKVGSMVGVYRELVAHLKTANAPVSAENDRLRAKVLELEEKIKKDAALERKSFTPAFA